MPSGKSGADNEEIETLPAKPSEAGDRKMDNPVKSLLSVYDSSDDDDVDWFCKDLSVYDA